MPGRWWLEMLIGEYSYAIDDKGRPVSYTHLDVYKRQLPVTCTAGLSVL